MECSFCEEEKTFNLKVGGDVGAEAIWCDECYCNLEICDMPISKNLKVQLIMWDQQYGEWMDWNKDSLLPNGLQLENEHNRIGELLTVAVRHEFGEKYKVRFSPSPSARMYANRDF